MVELTGRRTCKQAVRERENFWRFAGGERERSFSFSLPRAEAERDDSACELVVDGDIAGALPGNSRLGGLAGDWAGVGIRFAWFRCWV